MAIEQIEQLTYREQKLLQRAIGRETLEEFAHSCAARIMVNEPMTVKEAMASEHAEEWHDHLAAHRSKKPNSKSRCEQTLAMSERTAQREALDQFSSHPPCALENKRAW